MSGKRTPHYCNTAPHMKETIVQTPHQAQTADDGFSLLELVVAVSIMLILGVVGFVAYQNYTDNARQATADKAANDILTAVVAAANSPNGDPVHEVEQYNQTSADLFANITTADRESLVVRTEMCDGTQGSALVAGNFDHVETTDFGDVTYQWNGEPGASTSTRTDCSGNTLTNLVTNPGFEYGTHGYGHFEPGGSTVHHSSHWSKGGSYSAEHHTIYDVSEGSAYINIATSNRPGAFERGKTYTIYADLMKEHDSTYGAIHGVYLDGANAESPAAAGEYRLRAVFTVPETGQWHIRLIHKGIAGEPPIYWDNVMALEGDVETEYFDGDGPGLSSVVR